MSARPKYRILALELAIGAVLVLLCWAEYKTVADWLATQDTKTQDISEWLAKYQTLYDSYGTVAKHIETSVTEMQQSLLHFVSRDDRSDWERFQRQSREFRQWINATKDSSPRGKLIDLKGPLALSQDIATFLNEVDDAFARYESDARILADALPKLTDAGRRFEAVQRLEEDSHKLLLLTGQARGYGEAVRLIRVKPVHFPWPHLAIITSLLVLIGLCGWLALVVNRRKITVMRDKLTASDMILERQAKLARKGHVAAELAHEIRNPLTAINIRLYTLQKSLNESGGEHEDAAVIRREIRRLNAILEDFLHLDRPPEPQFVSLSTESLLAEARDLMAPQLAHQGIQLQIDHSEDGRLRADPHQLQQVLINLIKNAADSIGHDGTVTLRSRKITAPLRGKPTDVVVLEVADTGAGIPLDVQERMFDPFFTTKKAGTGLGLSVSERIVQKHGGSLDFDTEINHGTTFRIVLPVEQPASP